ncbi:MAG: DinB family protein [Acidobacteriota bacterium]|nr:MAG: DinB family protein [Acidobacteriota bacterium]
MSEFWPEVIGRQYAASIEMLKNAVDACPEALWDDRSDGTPIWHIVYHTIFFCDLYLTENLEAFKPRDYHVDHYHFLPGDYKEFGGIVKTPERCYSTAQMLEYADHCTRKAKAVFASLNEKRARERCGFWWYELNVGEFLINSLRHNQHHGAQIALILRRRADIGIDWLGTEHNEPPSPTW